MAWKYVNHTIPQCFLFTFPNSNLLTAPAPNPLSAQVTKRFSNPSAAFALSQSVPLVGDTAVGNDLFFMCPTTCTRGSNAFTVNTGTGTQINTISFCSPFFTAGSFAKDKAAYLATTTSRRAPTRDKFPPPTAKGTAFPCCIEFCN
jgi:hypothetical protein